MKEQNLFDYNSIRNSLHTKDDMKETVSVFFYTKSGDNIVVYGDNENKFASFLTDQNANIAPGEIFICDGNILCSIGKEEIKNDNHIEYNWSIQKAMGSLYSKISMYFSNKNIKFIEFQDISQCYYGFILASYSYEFLKKKPSETTPLNLIYSLKHEEIIQIAHNQNLARFLGDTPANLMTPTIFVSYVKEMFKDLNVTIKILEEDQIKDLNMNLMYSVGQGSNEPSKLLTIEYNGDSESEIHKIAMVGKGVTFDSGGISLKPGADMHRQKMDMMGGATMLLSFKTAVEMSYKINATCVIPLVENMPGSKATKPGDVYKAMNGLSVEINNTDAEGRLILADGLCYAQRCFKNKPEYLINCCTLTGAIKIALGNVYAGYFTNNDEFSHLINKAAENSSELLWRMPLSGFYKKQLSSNVADCQNIGGRLAGACTAAEFLHQFVEDGVKWAHFDMAGIKDEGILNQIYKKGATGRPIPAFVALLKSLQ